MGLPATVRVNTTVNFPSLVFGTGPIILTKLNGVWTVGFSMASLAVQTPAPANYATDYFLMYDSVANQLFNVPITGGPFGRARMQRSVTSTPIVVTATDEVLNCNINVNAACALPAAASRLGLPLTFKDLGQASAHNITITPNGAETIDGAANVKLTNNRQELTLVPFNDGVNSGWFLG